MTPGGRCFQCRELTSRYDTDRRRWACRACWPSNTRWEDAIAAALASEHPSASPEDDRPDGMTRQEWRRRLRLALNPAPPATPDSDKGREAKREAGLVRQFGDPWRHRGARGTWGGA